MKKIALKSGGTKSHMWTKDEIKKIFEIWESSTIDEVAEELGIERIQVQYMANQIRAAGYELAKKHRKGYLSSLIKEALGEPR